MGKILTTILAGALVCGLSGCSKKIEKKFSCELVGDGVIAEVTEESGPFSTENCLNLYFPDGLEHKVCDGDQEFMLGCKKNNQWVLTNKDKKIFYGEHNSIASCPTENDYFEFLELELVKLPNNQKAIFYHEEGKILGEILEGEKDFPITIECNDGKVMGVDDKGKIFYR